MRSFQLFSLVFSLSLTLTSCGGPTQKAKIANVVQVLMANLMEAFATKGSGSEIVFNCGDRSGDEGSLTYTVPDSLDNPLDLINNPEAAVGLEVTFDECRIEVCQDAVILDGGDAVLTMSLSTLFGTVSEDEIPASFQLSVENQDWSGFVGGTFTFAYSLDAIFSTDTLSELNINSADPAVPLVIDGVTYPAEDISELADGC